MTALQHLNDMRKEGLITALGLCNFDSSHTDAICTSLGEGAIVSNQVQVSSVKWPLYLPESPSHSSR